PRPLMYTPPRAALVGLERFREALTPADRIAPDGGTKRSGYGVQVRALELTPIVQSEIRRATDASVNDILVAACTARLDGGTRLTTSTPTGCRSQCRSMFVDSPTAYVSGELRDVRHSVDSGSRPGRR